MAWAPSSSPSNWPSPATEPRFSAGGCAHRAAHNAIAAEHREAHPWRDFFLSAVAELRDGRFGTPTETTAPDVIDQLTPSMLFDAIAIQVDGPRAWDEELSIDVVLTDVEESWRLRLANGVLTHSSGRSGKRPA